MGWVGSKKGDRMIPQQNQRPGGKPMKFYGSVHMMVGATLVNFGWRVTMVSKHGSWSNMIQFLTELLAQKECKDVKKIDGGERDF